MLSCKNLTIEDIEKIKFFELTGNIVKRYLSLVGGYKTKDFSVKINSCSMNVTILNPTIDRTQVETICKKFQSIDYDEYTGEILQGANFFVFVEYEYHLFDNYPVEYSEKAKEIFFQLKNSINESTFNIDKNLYLLKDYNYHAYEIRAREHQYISGRYVRTVKDLASAMYRYDCSHQLR